MKKSNVIGLTVGIVVTIVAVSLISWFAIRPVPTLIQGEVEATDIKISSKLAGRIEQMDVQEGERVKKGQLLFVLSTPEAEAKLQQAEAARMAASAQSTKARKGARVQEIEGAMNIWKKAEAGLELARKSYERVKNLYESGVVPEQKYDEAAANLKAMETTAAAAKAQYDMAIEGARREDREAAEALVKQASGAVSEVESYISDAMQYSPIDGEISTVIAQQGELISAGYPVVTLLERLVGDFQHQGRPVAENQDRQRTAGLRTGHRPDDRTEGLLHGRAGRIRDLVRHPNQRRLRYPHVRGQGPPRGKNRRAAARHDRHGKLGRNPIDGEFGPPTIRTGTETRPCGEVGSSVCTAGRIEPKT